MSDSKATTAEPVARKHWTEDAVKACKASGRWILKRSRFGDGSAEVMSEVTVGFLAGYDCAKRAHPPAAPEGLERPVSDLERFCLNDPQGAAALLQSRDATIEGLRAELAEAKDLLRRARGYVVGDIHFEVGSEVADAIDAALAERNGG